MSNNCTSKYDLVEKSYTFQKIAPELIPKQISLLRQLSNVKQPVFLATKIDDKSFDMYFDMYFQLPKLMIYRL